jgi:thiaminase
VIVDTSFFEVGQFLQLCIFVYLEGSKEQIMKTVNSSDDLVYAHFFDTLEGSTVEKSMTENRRIFEQDLKVAH